jgi:MFS family permease
MNKAESLKARPYAYFVLFVLTITYILNFIDRTILSILAEEIKAGLQIDDASLGFLYGTAFAVFFSIFGIPLARLADVWNRKRLIGSGVFLWSLMTALSGTAHSFVELAIYRVGVGVGEAAAAPASLSMLADSFPKKMRATAYGIWSTGVFIGSALGFAVGGATLAVYHRWFPSGQAPFGIRDWQLSMFLVGLPGLLVALVVYMLREPKRGQMDEHPVNQLHPQPMRMFLQELAAVIPPFTIWTLYRLGGGFRLVALNIGYGLLLFAGASSLTYIFGSPGQWLTLAIGLYSFISWLQRIRIIDYPCYALVFQAKAMRYSVLGFSLIGFNSYGLGFWFAPYIIRRFQATPQDVGAMMGIIVLISGFLSIALGGYFSDLLKRMTPKARPYMGLVSMLALPFYGLALNADVLSHLYAYASIGIFLGMIWIPSSLAMASELCTPRTRATSIAFNQLAGTLLGLAMGPYIMGEISVSLGNVGYSEADRLQWAMLLGLGFTSPIAAYLLYKSSKYVVVEESTVVERAAAAGEKG